MAPPYQKYTIPDGLWLFGVGFGPVGPPLSLQLSGGWGPKPPSMCTVVPLQLESFINDDLFCQKVCHA